MVTAIDAPSDYEVLELTKGGDTNAIIKKDWNYNRSDYTFKIVVPDCGNARTALTVLRYFRQDEQSMREARIREEEAFQAKLSRPHVYVQVSNRTKVCYCGNLESALIHIPEEEDTETS